MEVATRLARHYVSNERKTDAARILDFARAALGASEPDLLHRLAEAYRLAGGTTSSEQLLAMVLEVDPRHSAAAMQLSSLWADEGLHLAAAERLARDAARRQPLDPLYRGNVGWVLYRSGELEAAKDELLSAVAMSDDRDPSMPAAPGDDAGTAKPGHAHPVLLDRAGDALYRLGDRQTAAALWERAQRRLGDADVATTPGADIDALRLSLPRKLQQHRTGQDVQVAAVAAGDVR